MSEETEKTNHTLSAASDKIREFFGSFKDDSGRYTYLDAIDRMMPLNRTFLEINYADIATHSEMEDVFNNEPDFTLAAMARAVVGTLQQRYPEYAKSIEDEITVRITNYPLQKTVRQINSKSSGKFISIKAMLIRMSPIESIPKVAVYVCPDNHPTKQTGKKDFTISGPPLLCSNPNCKHREFELKQEASTFADYQILQLQELPNELPPGKLPKTLGVFVHGDLVDSARMGDTVEINGIVRAELSNIIKLGSQVQTYRHRLYANNIIRLANENDFGGKIDEKDLNIIRSVQDMSEDDATAHIVSSFATHIHGHEMVKEALILQMIGSDAQVLDDGTRVRGDINIFLVGDPGTAKSEMGKSVYRSAPRAFYASGRGSSGVGLTAATIQDKTTGAYMLEPGVTVLADEGEAVIDEFDKMRPEDRSALHEVMEQQSVSVSKGGITATLNARASILAIANPVYGRYDPFKNLTENIPSIPIPLLTRFDLIFVVRDVAAKDQDEKIARHMIATHKSTATLRDKKSFESELFAKYLRVAKQGRPKLSKEAEEKIIEYYLKMRNSNNDDADSGFTITPRQLEGLIRLTTARAKFLLKDTADEHDAGRAIFILEEMFRSSGVDVNTGKVDIGVLEGKPKSEVSKIQLFQDIMRGMVGDSHGAGVTEKEIISEMTKSEKWDEPGAAEFLKKAIRENIIYESTPNHYRQVS